MEQNTQSNPFQGLHKQKLYALIIAAVGLLSCLLPWWSFSGISYMGMSTPSISVSGMHDLGIIAFLAFAAAGVVPFVMGDKTKPYDGQPKMIVAACFAGAGAIALIQMLRTMHGLGFGIFIAIAAGAVGALFVWGIIKMPTKP
jgi:preprotein translocase subunit Sec61beta